jgi:hypothetical protein
MALQLTNLSASSLTITVDTETVISISVNPATDFSDPCLAIEVHRADSPEVQISRYVDLNDLYALLQLLPKRRSPECNWSQIKLPTAE